MFPVYNERALLVGKTLVIADLHIGLEYELRKKGIFIFSQYEKIKKRIVSLLEKTKAKRIILLGDLKHNIPRATFEEYREIPKLIDELSEKAQIIIIKGNHDGNLEKLLPNYEILTNFEEKGIFYTHGHRKIELEENKTYVFAHFHPCIEFKDEFGFRIKEIAWIRGKLRNGSKFIILPAFNELIEGMPFNRELKREGVLKHIDFSSVEAYLLDGTCVSV